MTQDKKHSLRTQRPSLLCALHAELDTDCIVD